MHSSEETGERRAGQEREEGGQERRGEARPEAGRFRAPVCVCVCVCVCVVGWSGGDSGKTEVLTSNIQKFPFQ